jgi:RHS repeat-associated protein
MDKGFVGGTKDPTGLTHLGAREYDPAIGVFLSVDAVIDPADPLQLHPHAYAQNNPVTRSDPNGRWPDFVDKALSNAKSAASSIGNATANFVASTVESIKEDPLKFATGLAVGIACTVAVAAVCSTGVGCLILAGAVAGAAAAGAEYGVDVAQGEREFLRLGPREGDGDWWCCRRGRRRRGHRGRQSFSGRPEERSVLAGRPPGKPVTSPETLPALAAAPPTTR